MAARSESIDGNRNVPKVAGRCRFGAESENREEGNGTVTVHRLGRTAELPLVGANHELDPRYVRRVCDALGLDWSRLPEAGG